MVGSYRTIVSSGTECAGVRNTSRTPGGRIGRGPPAPGPNDGIGAAADDVADVQENIRIDRGRCVARCYRVAEMFAMWLIDVGVLQFYDAEGEMLHTVNLFTELQPQRAAA